MIFNKISKICKLFNTFYNFSTTNYIFTPKKQILHIYSLIKNKIKKNCVNFNKAHNTCYIFKFWHKLHTHLKKIWT